MSTETETETEGQRANRERWEEERRELDALVERRKERAAEIRAEREASDAAKADALVRIDTTPKVTYEPVLCAKCGAPFQGIVMTVPGLRPLRKVVCEPCVEERIAEEARGTRQPPRYGASGDWQALCPPEFRTVDEGGATVIARLLRDCPRLPEIRGWKFGPIGLLIQGATGLCKTRAVWRLLRDQFDNGKSIVAVSSGKFARDYAGAAGSHTQDVWFDKLAEADIFFLDDLGKKPWTANAWGEFFELIDERAKNHRPVIITTNEDRKTMQAKCVDPVAWGPLNRRLTESCQLIAL